MLSPPNPPEASRRYGWTLRRILWFEKGEAAIRSALDLLEARFPMKAVADTFVVARSNLIKRVPRPRKPRGPYRKAGDGLLLGLIRRLVDERPSYGYRLSPGW